MKASLDTHVHSTLSTSRLKTHLFSSLKTRYFRHHPTTPPGQARRAARRSPPLTRGPLVPSPAPRTYRRRAWATRWERRRRDFQARAWRFFYPSRPRARAPQPSRFSKSTPGRPRLARRPRGPFGRTPRHHQPARACAARTYTRSFSVTRFLASLFVPSNPAPCPRRRVSRKWARLQGRPVSVRAPARALRCATPTPRFFQAPAPHPVGLGPQPLLEPLLHPRARLKTGPVRAPGTPAGRACRAR
mmetsp:Transcript_6782/g.25617  ORF Transcript_6782/g.25617 Transcript_6782/m.25617 type:complete len:245 (-) Transcript_6782:2279-3013(-)